MGAEDHEAGTRYRLLETIRQYGEERVTAHGETESLRVRHASFYAAFVALASERVWGPEQIAWAKQVVAERDNILSAIANAIDVGNAELAVRLVAHTPSHQNSIGEIFLLPASRVLDLTGAERQPGYPRVVVAAAFIASHRGDHDLAAERCQHALEASQRVPDPVAHPGIEAAVCSLRAQESLAAGSYDEAISLYARAAEFARADGYAGAAAISLAYSVSASLLAGHDVESVSATAEESVHLARQSGMPSAIALSLNALA